MGQNTLVWLLVFLALFPTILRSNVFRMFSSAIFSSAFCLNIWFCCISFPRLPSCCKGIKQSALDIRSKQLESVPHVSIRLGGIWIISLYLAYNLFNFNIPVKYLLFSSQMTHGCTVLILLTSLVI